MRIGHTLLLMAFTGVCVLSCKSSLDNLSERISRSEAFIEWDRLLADPPKRIRRTDSKKLALQMRYKRAGFKMINDSYIKNSFPRKDTLQVRESSYSPEDRAKFMKLTQSMEAIMKEFPEIKKLSKEDKMLVLKNAFRLMKSRQ